MKTRTSKNRGFMALFATIIMSAVLVAFVVTAGRSGLFARFDALGTEDNTIAYHLASSCINEALLAFAASSTVAAGSVVVLGIDEQNRQLSCTIKDMSLSGALVTVHAYASFNHSFSSISVTANRDSQTRIQILTWDVTS